MATNLKQFDSAGGFSVDKNIIIDSNKNIIEANTIELKNLNYSDATKKSYILKGLNTSILSLDDQGTLITIPSSSLNFITSHVIGINDSGNSAYSLKIESCISCNSVGNVSTLSDLKTIIRDSIPTGETWSIVAKVSNLNSYSYASVRSGTTSTIKWVVSTDVMTVFW